MPATILTPIFDRINAFLSEIVQKEEIFTSESLETFTRSLSDFLFSIARDLLKLWLELNQPTENLLKYQGQKYFYKKTEDKRYVTHFGEVIVSRRVYRNEVLEKNVIPLETSLKMENQYATVEVRELIGYLTGFLTPKTIWNVLSRFWSCSPSVSTIQRIGDEIGKVMEESKEEIINAAHQQEQELPEGTEVLAVSLDGVNVMLREPGTRKRRPKTRPGHELSENGASCYKNAGVATLSFYKPSAGEDNRIALQRQRTIVAAHAPEDRMKALKKELEQEVNHWVNIASPNTEKVVVMDGARGLWSYIDDCKLFKGWVQIVDFHHCCEHLSKLAEEIFGKSSAKGRKWYSKYRGLFLTAIDGVKRMLRSAKRYLKLLYKGRLFNQLQYFINNEKRMRYASFRQNGLPIGSGPVEASCKTIVKARLCCSGMRWSRQRAQHILRIRTTIRNNRWDVAWNICKLRTTTTN